MWHLILMGRASLGTRLAHNYPERMLFLGECTVLRTTSDSEIMTRW